jgi:hypothetical protein
MVRATFVAGSSPGFTRPVAFTGAATFTPSSKSKVSALILRWWAKTGLLGFTPCSVSAAINSPTAGAKYLPNFAAWHGQANDSGRLGLCL